MKGNRARDLCEKIIGRPIDFFIGAPILSPICRTRGLTRGDEMEAATLQAITTERATLTDEMAARASDHAAYMTAAKARMKYLAEREAMLIAGLDVSRLDRARRVIYVHGDVTKVVHSDMRRDHVRANAVEDAKKDIAEGAPKLKKAYFGVKNYAHFGDQREDHQYGYGPRHGSIVFAIGLTKDAIKRDLTAEEIEDVLYMLSVLPRMCEPKKAAA